MNELIAEILHWTNLCGPAYGPYLAPVMLVVKRGGDPAALTARHPDRRMVQVHESHDRIRPDYEWGYQF